jgi:hypothetical protein
LRIHNTSVASFAVYAGAGTPDNKKLSLDLSANVELAAILRPCTTRTADRSALPQRASTPQAGLRALVQSEPNYFVDGRKPLAKSGSASRRHPVHGQHRHEIPSLTLQGLELSLGRRQPRCSTAAIVLALYDAEEWMNGVGPPQRYDAQHQEFT